MEPGKRKEKTKGGDPSFFWSSFASSAVCGEKERREKGGRRGGVV